MSSVTQRINEIKQPYGGYVPPKDFTIKTYSDGIELKTNENISPILVGLVVDYLARFVMGATPEIAFRISRLGAFKIGEEENANALLKAVQGLDDNSIRSACKLCGYDVCFRADPSKYKAVQTIEPNSDTIENIRTMVQRSMSFWEQYGPIEMGGLLFEGGYTHTVSSGDGDYLTADTLWDFKVSKRAPTNKHTLQLLMYYIMGCHSIHNEFKKIRFLGIFNPRLNTVYTLDISKISQNTITEVSTDVIGYKDVSLPNQGYSCLIKQKPDLAYTTDYTTLVGQKVQKTNSAPQTGDWVLGDLIARYNVSRPKIIGDFIGRGLPYYRVGQTYHFRPRDVINWEIHQKYIPYGRNQFITLPAYSQYKTYLIYELKKAEQSGNTDRILTLKKEAHMHGIPLWSRKDKINTATIVLTIALLIFIITLVLLIVSNL